MTNKEIAKRLRHIVDYHLDTTTINSLADELDPPKPEPGTVVWYLALWDDVWHMGIVEENDRGYARTQWGGVVDLDEIEWKPARILRPRQVAVDVPPLSEWPKGSLVMEAAITGGERDIWVAELITRQEAKRMEERDE